MTLIVSDVSKCGCAMFSDTAVASVDSTGRITSVQSPAKKILYLERANVGLGLWGQACVEVNNRRLPLLKYLAEQVNILPFEFQFDQIASSVRSVLSRVRSSLLDFDDELECGVHLAGFDNGQPMLFHICPNQELSDFQVQREFPNLWATRLDRMGLDTSNWSGFLIPPEYDLGTASGAYWQPSEGTSLGIYPFSMLRSPEQVTPVERVYIGLYMAGFFHLRNGCGFPEIAEMFDEEYGSENPVEIIRQNRNFPTNNFGNRVEAYLKLVGDVIDKACASSEVGKHVALSRPLDFFVFNNDGVVVRDTNESSIELPCFEPDTRCFL